MPRMPDHGREIKRYFPSGSCGKGLNPLWRQEKRCLPVRS
ncbi:hypothetical protein HMPREF3038_00768 [Akkermansia sp. KLE1797]|nr:hypothetical protein HMPREF3038_00768 [Akkermansia sp. KLE1797]KXU54577.1 hypothetical protein HMPREF3039_01474 [Akkermansia sp. KLE1798]KZA04970.1 hypothetical protein HMPREF1326_01552 [Akkermansia sp. KLE1605]